MSGKAAIYVRVSTEEQATSGHSIKAQTQKLQQYCEMMGIEIYDVYVDDGISGGVPLAKRPAGKTLADDVKSKKVTHVVAYSLSRLFRDVVDGLTNIRAWDKKGISVVLLDVGGSLLDTSSAMGKMMISVMLACNELERNITGERVALVHQNKKQNRKVWTKGVFGFDRDGDDLVPNSQEQEIVKRIKHERSNGKSYQKIADGLNGDGVPTKENKTWHAASVSYIFKNDLYSAVM